MSRTKKIIDRWLDRIPNAATAYRTEPVYHAQLQHMLRLFEALDMVMEDEGIDEEKRTRIIRTLVYGAPDEAQALARLADQEARIQEAIRQPPDKSWIQMGQA
jgi:hypothetical protein